MSKAALKCNENALNWDLEKDSFAVMYCYMYYCTKRYQSFDLTHT